MTNEGSATKKTRSDRAILAAQNIVKALCGEMLTNIVIELKTCKQS